MSTQISKKRIPSVRLLPRRLKPGDLVRVLSPASPAGPSVLRDGLAVLRSLKLRVEVNGLPAKFARGYLAGGDSERAAALNDAFRDPDVRAVFCARGGYGSARLLPLLRDDLVAADPKVVFGFSDITGLLAGLFRRCGLVAFHGPVAATFSGDRAERRRLGELLFSDRVPVLAGGRTLQPGKADGAVVGGNLSVLCGLLGTPFFPETEGCILFLEEVGEPLYKIDRMLTQLRLAGIFDRVAGAALGSWAGCGPTGDVEDLFRERLNRPDIPVVAGLPAGHGPVNQPFPLGLPAVLDGEKREIRFPFPATRPAEDE
ncbi:MAG: LD-carboxypeptidase [Desulfococcaceae bacterium]